jgi:peroxiredoxin
MKTKPAIFMIVVLMAFLDAVAAPPETIRGDFRLQNVDGKTVSLNDYSDAKGFIVVFTCNHCPFAKLYPERLNQLNSKFKPLGIPLIAISSTDTIAYEEDSFLEMIRRSKEEHYNFPYLCDRTQGVAKNFGAQKTPHAFVIWKENGNYVVKYNGAIDDNGAEPGQVKEHYVETAVQDLLNGKPVETTETKSLGCRIHYRN